MSKVDLKEFIGLLLLLTGVYAILFFLVWGFSPADDKAFLWFPVFGWLISIASLLFVAKFKK